MGFDRKENFRSSFKEDRKSNKAPKRCRKQDGVPHGRALGSTAVLQWPGPRTARRTAVRPAVPLPSTAVPPPQWRRFRVLQFFYLSFWDISRGPLPHFFESILGQNQEQDQSSQIRLISGCNLRIQACGFKFFIKSSLSFLFSSLVLVLVCVVHFC